MYVRLSPSASAALHRTSNRPDRVSPPLGVTTWTTGLFPDSDQRPTTTPCISTSMTPVPTGRSTTTANSSLSSSTYSPCVRLKLCTPTIAPPLVRNRSWYVGSDAGGVKVAPGIGLIGMRSAWCSAIRMIPARNTADGEPAVAPTLATDRLRREAACVSANTLASEAYSGPESQRNPAAVPIIPDIREKVVLVKLLLLSTLYPPCPMYLPGAWKTYPFLDGDQTAPGNLGWSSAGSSLCSPR